MGFVDDLKSGKAGAANFANVEASDWVKKAGERRQAAFEKNKNEQRFKESPCYEKIGYDPYNFNLEKAYSQCEKAHHEKQQNMYTSIVVVTIVAIVLVVLGYKYNIKTKFKAMMKGLKESTKVVILSVWSFIHLILMLIGYSTNNNPTFRQFFWPISSKYSDFSVFDFEYTVFFAPYIYDVSEFFVYAGTPWLIWGLMKYVKKTKENELNK